MTAPHDSNTTPPALDDLRRQIDELDHRLLDLLAGRNDIVRQVALYKRAHGVAIRDHGREQFIIADRRAHAESLGLKPDTTESIFRLMLWASRDRQAALKAELPESVEPRSIAIIGGKGQMGRCFGAMFEEFGNEVLIADLDTKLTPADAAARADIVLISVPIDVTLDVIKQLGPTVRGGALLTDITSIKAAPVAAMLDHSDCDVLGLHPLFGPSVHSMQGQRIVITDARSTSDGADWLRAVFKARGLLITDATPDDHDRAMAVVQVLTHFSTEVMGRTLTDFGLPLEQTLPFTSPVYAMELLMTARHFAQSADLYASIQMSNPLRSEVTDAFVDAANRLRAMIDEGDHDALEATFEDVRAFFGEFSVKALEQSSYLIDRLVERS